MRAVDVMVRGVKTVGPEADVADAVALLGKYDVSALPVVDKDGQLVGMISEADLIHRFEIGTEKHHPWWMEAMTAASSLAGEFAKSHGKKVEEVMTANVVSVTEDTPISEIAGLFERKRIKRVPVVRDGKLVGIVSRSNLIQALASAMAHGAEGGEAPDSDREIRLELLDRLAHQPWTDFGERNIIVTKGVVHVWGLVGSSAERAALIALAEGVPGVTSVSDEMISAY